MGDERDRQGVLPDDLSTAEREALHEVEVGIEWLRRAEGSLIAFHHAVGHGMDHLEAAERRLREADHDHLADRVRDDLLPRGVTADDRWSYALVEEYQRSFLAEMAAFEAAVRADLAGGERHVAERHQRRAWRERARSRADDDGGGRDTGGEGDDDGRDDDGGWGGDDGRGDDSSREDDSGREDDSSREDSGDGSEE